MLCFSEQYLNAKEISCSNLDVEKREKKNIIVIYIYWNNFLN